MDKPQVLESEFRKGLTRLCEKLPRTAEEHLVLSRKAKTVTVGRLISLAREVMKMACESYKERSDQGSLAPKGIQTALDGIIPAGALKKLAEEHGRMAVLANPGVSFASMSSDDPEDQAEETVSLDEEGSHNDPNFMKDIYSSFKVLSTRWIDDVAPGSHLSEKADLLLLSKSWHLAVKVFVAAMEEVDEDHDVRLETMERVIDKVFRNEAMKIAAKSHATETVRGFVEGTQVNPPKLKSHFQQ